MKGGRSSGKKRQLTMQEREMQQSRGKHILWIFHLIKKGSIFRKKRCGIWDIRQGRFCGEISTSKSTSDGNQPSFCSRGEDSPDSARSNTSVRIKAKKILNGKTKSNIQYAQYRALYINYT